MDIRVVMNKSFVAVTMCLLFSTIYKKRFLTCRDVALS